MRITEITACPVDLPYRRPWRISGGAIVRAQHVLIQIETDEGCYGVGEATPFPVAYAEETQTTVLHVIQEYLRPALLGYDPFDQEIIDTALAQAIPGHRLAKAGLDLAMHDLIGRALGLPVYKLLGGLYHRQVPIAFSIGIKSTAEMVEEAVSCVECGFAAIKLKIGHDPQADLEHVAAVREAIGPRVTLRVDANEGYQSGEALPILRKMERFDLEYIEQPVPRWDLDGMARLCTALDTPVAADESAFTPSDVLTLVKRQAADLINVSPCKSGLRNSKRMAAIAEANGMNCVVGSMLEFGLGTAASLQFASATRNVTHACELIGPLLLEGDILVELVFSQLPATGYWMLPSGNGLGVTVDDRWTAGLAKDDDSSTR
ncbi:MAG: hypothetical protein M5U01_10105 [Ardenticatenaceae bacterium]|nr:hypothetical protein [Ardenticatenaceae bacterium]